MTTIKTFYRGKSIVITGAASGIGLALAENFAALGAQLALADIEATKLNDVVAEIHSKHPNAKIYTSTFDVAQKVDWLNFLKNANSELGHLDMLVNNAGIEGSSRPVWATDDETLERVMAVNFFGMVHGTKAVLPYLTQQPWSAIVNVSSIFGLIGPPNAADYAASKFAIRGYTEALHAELSQVYPNIQVHLVHPGGINTQITRLPQSQKFKSEFLTTPPLALARVIAESVMRNRARIVYGNQSTLVKIASRLLPLAWLSSAIARQMRKLNMTDDYQKDHPGFKIKENDL